MWDGADSAVASVLDSMPPSNVASAPASTEPSDEASGPGEAWKLLPLQAPKASATRAEGVRACRGRYRTEAQSYHSGGITEWQANRGSSLASRKTGEQR